MAETTKNETKAGKKQDAQNFSHSAAEMFKSFAEKMPKIDREDMLNKHRKNLETLSDAQKMIMEVLKTITQLQSQFVRQSFDEIHESLREVMRNPTSQDKISIHADKIKETMAKAVDHSSNIANVILKSNLDVYNLVQDRFKENVESLQKKATHH